MVVSETRGSWEVIYLRILKKKGGITGDLAIGTIK